MKQTTKRHIAAWMLLAVFVPMLLLSSLHLHDEGAAAGSTCTECVQHQCSGHLGQQTLSMHVCVLCQFLTLPMLAATVVAFIVYVHSCKQVLARPLRGNAAEGYGIISTRGP